MEKTKKNDCRYGLHELYASGFQVFSDLVRIPLARLTLLYGPNSSGKSAVEDALKLISETCRYGAFDLDANTMAPRLARHWRRSGESLQDLQQSMTLGVKATLPFFPWSELYRRLIQNRQSDPVFEFGSMKATNRSDHQDFDLEYRLTFEQTHKKTSCLTKGKLAIDRRLEIVINGVVIIWLSRGSFGVNFKHPCLEGLDSKFPENRHFATIKSSTFSRYKNGRLEFLGPISLDDSRNIDVRLLETTWLYELEGLQQSGPFMGCDDDEDFRQWIGRRGESIYHCCAVLHDVAKVFDFIYENTRRVLSPYLFRAVPAIAPASRTVPTEKDLTFCFFNNEQENDGVFRLNASRFQFPGENKRQLDSCGLFYQQLANACRGTLTKSAAPISTVKKSLSLLDRANVILSQTLFPEKGYSIAFDYRVILSPQEFLSLQTLEGDANSKLPGDFPLVLRLFLKDAEGREFSFSEVGSGLGYVLPVILSAIDSSFSLVMSQQPELHLHPGLQSELGDVFIEASKGIEGAHRRAPQKLLVLETHSEQLLLRILRRIRDSNSNRVSGGSLLSHKEVAISFFDIKSDGSTKVTHIPIAANGEFGRRWPRGFFTEREKDLFDE